MENNFKHTKGPWTINPTTWKNKAGSKVIDIDALEANVECMASIYVGIENEDAESEASANAKLIAAAPCLLEALIEITQDLKEEVLSTSINDVLKRANEIIKKATE